MFAMRVCALHHVGYALLCSTSCSLCAFVLYIMFAMRFCALHHVWYACSCSTSCLLCVFVLYIKFSMRVRGLHLVRYARSCSTSCLLCGFMLYIMFAMRVRALHHVRYARWRSTSCSLCAFVLYCLAKTTGGLQLALSTQWNNRERFIPIFATLGPIDCSHTSTIIYLYVWSITRLKGEANKRFLQMCKY